MVTRICCFWYTGADHDVRGFVPVGDHQPCLPVKRSLPCLVHYWGSCFFYYIHPACCFPIMLTRPTHWLLTWVKGMDDAQSCYISYYFVTYCYHSVAQVWTTLERLKCGQHLASKGADHTKHLGSVLLANGHRCGLHHAFWQHLAGFC